MALLGEFKNIKSQAEEIREEIVNLENVTRGTKRRKLQRDRVSEANILVDEYNDSISEVRKIVEISFTSVDIATTRANAKGVLRQIETQCEKAIRGLRSHLSPISAEEQDRLSKYRSEIEDLASELDKKFVKNMNKTIDVFEEGHYLASTLISSRMVTYLIDRIPGEDDEEKADFLEKKGMIEESDEESFLIKVKRQARNYFSHDIKAYPDSSDALSLLGDSVKLLKLYIDLKEEISDE